jgi:mannose-6-phosphate isomerase-like protein (cupin superfamily)
MRTGARWSPFRRRSAWSSTIRPRGSPAFAGRGIEFIRATLPPFTATDDLRPYHPAIDKYVLVETGTLRIVVGAEPHLLQEGDAFYFRASVSHRFENPSPERCSYLAILDYAPLG